VPGADPIDIYVGTQVRTRRRKLGMSQVELGARIGVTFQQVQKYENANNRISASALMRIADALEIAAAELLPDGPQVQPDDEYVAMFARETANRGLVAAWGKLEADQREQIQNLVLGLAQKNAGVRRRRPPGQR
jgi:transcriptional regulator with XRE-family HTH domain